MKRIIVFALFFLTVMACSDESKVISFNLNTINDNYEANVEVLYHQVEGKDINSKAINETIRKEFIKSIDPDNDDVVNTSIESAIQAFDSEYRKFKTDFPDSDQVWQISVETEILYASKEVLTIALNTYIDTGGAHGNDSIIFLNFNPRKGTLYTLDDFIKDKIGFTALAETYFKMNIANEDGNEVIEDYFFGEPFHLPDNIGYSEEGLILLYNVYEIASYAQGYTEFRIPFSELNTYLKVK